MRRSKSSPVDLEDSNVPRRALQMRSFLRLVTVLSLVSVSVAGSIGVASAITPGAQVWAKRYNGPANSLDGALSNV